jgi:hypothetical protein
MVEEFAVKALAAGIALLLVPSPGMAQAKKEQRQQVQTQPARTEAPATVHDVQCLLMAITLAGSEDADAKTAGVSGTMFFGGKILGANPSVDLTAVVKSEALKLDEAKLPTLQQQCGDEMKAFGTKLQAVAAALPD